MSISLLSVLIAAGTALTNSTDETVLGSYSIPAHYLAEGKAIRVRGSVRTTASNSTDTLKCRVRVGDTTLTGTAVIATAAIDQVDDDVFVFEIELTARESGAAADLVAKGWHAGPDAVGTAVLSAHAILADEDLTAALLVEVTGEWSVANAGNSCQLESLEVYEIA